MKVVGCGATDIGRVRAINEDALLLDFDHGLFAVADGMGGHAAGEVASGLAVEALSELLARPRDPAEDASELLSQAIEEASRSIAARSEDNPEFRHMGTTVVAALVDGLRLSIAHVGDSRAYLWRGGQIRQLTSDHSWVNELVRLGMLSREQAARDPRRNVVTRALGSGAVVGPDIWQGDLDPGDILLLCTDGLTSMLDDQHIGEVIAASAPALDQVCHGLIEAANAAGGEDNTTVIVLGFEPPV